MRFRQPRCPKCGSLAYKMSGAVATVMNLCRVDATGKVVDEDDDSCLDFEHFDSDVCWEYEDVKRPSDGKVELFCPNHLCDQCWWHTELLSERESELEAAVAEWVEAQEALEPNPVLASHEETERVVAAENRLRELMKKQPT
ncbi:hypothetical protein ACFL09_00700 [Planctomycetota bacterium]